MPTRLTTLANRIEARLDGSSFLLERQAGELTLTVEVDDYFQVMQFLRDEGALCFEQMIDLCGIDYQSHAKKARHPHRYAVVVHLLSLKHNWRLRVRVYLPRDDLLLIPSIKPLWPAADWYEREAFDLFGIVFEGHDDLRRILTDYGFVGHPLRKDFPVQGLVEMRYDEDAGKVVYEPVTVEERQTTPRVVREDDFGRR